MGEAFEPGFEIVRPFTGGVEVEVKETVGMMVDDSVAWPADVVEFNELLANSAKGIDAGEGIVTGEAGGSGPRDKVVELPQEQFDLPSPVQ